MSTAADFVKRLRQLIVVPVVVIQDAVKAPPICEALALGGIAAAEITLRTPAALQAIANVAEREHLFVGAGSVLTVGQATDAIAAGAKFIVSPGLDLDIVEKCRAADVPVLPGIATATDAMRAVNAGIDTVKFFPAVPAGGIAAVKALSGPFATLRFVPTGGITADTARDWLAVDSIIAVGGSWLTPPHVEQSGQFDEIAEITRRTLRAVSQ